MAGITQKSCVTLLPLWSLKKPVVRYIDVKQKETYAKLQNRSWYSNTDILLMLALLIITIIIIMIIIIILLLVLLLLLLPLTNVIVIIIINNDVTKIKITKNKIKSDCTLK